MCRKERKMSRQKDTNIISNNHTDVENKNNQNYHDESSNGERQERDF